MRAQLGEGDLFGAGPLTEEGRDLRERGRSRVDFEELKKTPRGTFGVPADVEPYTGPPAGAQVLHPVRYGPAPDPKFHKGGLSVGASPGFVLRAGGRSLAGGRG